jgi:hypothetical protein
MWQQRADASDRSIKRKNVATADQCALPKAPSAAVEAAAAKQQNQDNDDQN